MKAVSGVTGARFGMLVAGKIIGAKRVLCRCDCGAECIALVTELRRKRRQSCRACAAAGRAVARE